VLIEIRDDGRGIDWDAVKQRAVRMGAPAETRSDLTSCLFASGFRPRTA